jgi:hypothetical protein
MTDDNRVPDEGFDADEEEPGTADADLTEDETAPDENAEPLAFERFRQVCPHCRQPVTSAMDCCPYCGDVLFRYLRDSSFAPRCGLAAKAFALVVIALILLGTLAFLLSTLF